MHDLADVVRERRAAPRRPPRSSPGRRARSRSAARTWPQIAAGRKMLLPKRVVEVPVGVDDDRDRVAGQLARSATISRAWTGVERVSMTRTSRPPRTTPICWSKNSKRRVKTRSPTSSHAMAAMVSSGRARGVGSRAMAAEAAHGSSTSRRGTARRCSSGTGRSPTGEPWASRPARPRARRALRAGTSTSARSSPRAGIDTHGFDLRGFGGSGGAAGLDRSLVAAPRRPRGAPRRRPLDRARPAARPVRPLARRADRARLRARRPGPAGPPRPLGAGDRREHPALAARARRLAARASRRACCSRTGSTPTTCRAIAAVGERRTSRTR